ncbi:MAG: phosphatidylglycerophosphatase A [Pyrinomonadaceae bacterium]
MQTVVERRKPEGLLDHLALAITTCGVGYLPLMPGTFGSLVGVAIYVLISSAFSSFRYTPESVEPETLVAGIHAIIMVAFVGLILLGVWASGRSIELLGSGDPPEAVIDEVIGQLTVFLFIPFATSWLIIAAGFGFFRLFDIWKPFPIDRLQMLPGGLGICVDDVGAGICAGACLSVVYAVSLWV